jgi:hypothetical protein
MEGSMRNRVFFRSTALNGILVLLALLATFSFAGPAYCDYDYTYLKVPFAKHTFAMGIDGTNIVGYFNYTDAGKSRAFLYDGSSYTTLKVPGATQGAWAVGISGSNIVGYYANAWANHGFLYDGSVYTTIDVPGSSRTWANGIDGDNIVGYYRQLTGTYGFLYNGTEYARIDVPGADGTYATGISGNNIVGYSRVGLNDYHGFLYNGTDYTQIDVPEAKWTRALGISGSNIVGAFSEDGLTYHGFIYDVSTSLFTTLDAPKGFDTGLSGIDGDTILGFLSIKALFGNSTRSLGFVAEPTALASAEAAHAPLPSAIFLLLSGIGGIAAFRKKFGRA